MSMIRWASPRAGHCRLGAASPPVRKREEMTMDFFERLLGASPDGGDGSLEATFLLVLLAGVASLAGLARWLRGSARHRPEH
jgi:hypothetical protein